jgi:hypothetical protein
MRSKELQEALRLLTKVLTNSRVRPGQREQLQKAKRELEAVAQSGKLDRQRLFRAVEAAMTVALEIVEQEAIPKPE